MSAFHHSVGNRACNPSRAVAGGVGIMEVHTGMLRAARCENGRTSRRVTSGWPPSH